MNRLSSARREQILRALCEGNSMRATTRICGVSRTAVNALLRMVGYACEKYQAEVFVNLPSRRIQCDEIWAFVGCKDKNVPNVSPRTHALSEQIGDAWTWTALDPDSKLMIAWLVGERDEHCARAFMRTVAARVRMPKRWGSTDRVQISTDGLSLYLPAVEEAFGWAKVDYAQVVKDYGCYIDGPDGERRYSPSTCVGYHINVVMGNPDPAHISTSHVERSNLTLRMQQRRFTRLTNAFSRKVENLQRAVSLHMMFYNFVRRHQTIKTTPAFKVGVADHVWSLREVAELPERFGEETMLLAA